MSQPRPALVCIKIETQILENYGIATNGHDHEIYKFKGGRTIVVQIPWAFENPRRNHALAFATATQFLQAQAHEELKHGRIPTCEYLIPESMPKQYSSIEAVNADMEYDFMRDEFVILQVQIRQES